MLGIVSMMGFSGDFMVIAMDLMRYSYHEIFTYYYHDDPQNGQNSFSGE